VKIFARSSLAVAVSAGALLLPSLVAQDAAPELVSKTAGGVPWKNLAELKAAAAKGDPRARAQLGEQLLRGDRVPKDGAQALALLEQAARAGVGAAAFRIGMLLDDGDGVAQDRGRALGYFRAAAAGGVSEACHNVGAAYAGAHGVKRDYAEALGWLMLATKRGAGGEAEQAVRERIKRLNRPEWIAAGEKRAAEIERELAKETVAGLLPAPAPLIYNGGPEGNGGASAGGAALSFRSPTGSLLSWPGLGDLERAAERGETPALAALGQILLEGKLATEDFPRARTLLERAAEAGSVDAAQLLAEMHTRGGKVPPDAAKAFNYNLQAARGGSPQAMFNTGALFSNGLGTPRNFTEALAWLIVAKKHGIERDSEQRIRDYLAKTAPDQISIAEKRAEALAREIGGASKKAAPQTAK
jgi:uncharacterized protein